MRSRRQYLVRYWQCRTPRNRTAHRLPVRLSSPFTTALTTIVRPSSYQPHSPTAQTLTTMSTLPPTTSSPPSLPPSPTQLTVPSVQPVDPGLPPENVSLGPLGPFLESGLFGIRPFPGRIPPEIGDEIIDQLQDDVQSLRACALTCRDWHPRSRIYLFPNILLHGDDSRKPEEMNAFTSYLTSDQFLRPLVQSIHIPFPLKHFSMALLQQLPNLRFMVLSGKGYSKWPRLSFHPVLFACFRAHSHIQTLVLCHVKLCSASQLSTLILSLPSLRHLVFDKISFEGRANNSPGIIESARKNNYSKRTKLRVLEVSISELQNCV